MASLPHGHNPPAPLHSTLTYFAACHPDFESQSFAVEYCQYLGLLWM